MLKLLVLQESVDDRKSYIDRICKILVPKEYTRLDEIIEIVFFTTKEVQKEESSEDEIFEEELDNQQGDQKQDKKFDPAAFERGLLILGCGSADCMLVIPYSEVKTWLNDLWITERNDGMYWHLRIHSEDSKLYLDRKKGKGKLDITKFVM